MIKGLFYKIPERIRILFFWPVFGAAFWYLELMGADKYHVVHCALDDIIPFCEYFIIPYYFWFIYLAIIIVYGFFWDIPTLKNYMKYTQITYLTTLVIYMLFPNSQELRPETFANDNFFVDIVKFAYSFDTNTNVCPSIHVLGSMAVYFAARKSRFFGTFAWRAAFFAAAVIIMLSTLFVKQHSAVDIIAALAVGAIAYPMVYKKSEKGTREVADERKAMEVLQ